MIDKVFTIGIVLLHGYCPVPLRFKANWPDISSGKFKFKTIYEIMKILSRTEALSYYLIGRYLDGHCVKRHNFERE